MYKIYKNAQNTNGDYMQKKIVLFLCFLLWTGCGTKPKELGIEKINRELSQLTLEQLDYTGLAEVLEIENSQIYNQEEIAKELQLEPNMYHQIFFSKSEETTTYLIIEPVSEKKDEVNEQIQSYWKKKIEEAQTEEEKIAYQNRMEQAFKGNLIYIVDSDASKKLEKIKDNKVKVFPNMIYLKREEIQSVTGLNPNKLEAHTVAITDKLDTVTMYIIVKYKEENTVRKSINDYFENLEKEWETKDEEQYQLLKNRLEKQIGNYLVYIVSKDNEKAYQIIEKNYE